MEHADKGIVPSGADDPELWADPLWVCLERARNALIDDPRLLTEKKPEWEGGLNILEINRLAADAGRKPVFSTDETHEDGIVVARLLTVYHPGPGDPVVIETWNRYGGVVPASKARRVVAHLRAWQFERERVRDSVREPRGTRTPSTRPRRRRHAKLVESSPADPLTTGKAVAMKYIAEHGRVPSLRFVAGRLGFSADNIYRDNPRLAAELKAWLAKEAHELLRDRIESLKDRGLIDETPDKRRVGRTAPDDGDEEVA